MPMGEDSKDQEVLGAFDDSKEEVGFPQSQVRPKKKNFGALMLVILALGIALFFAYSMIFGGESSDRFVKEDEEKAELISQDNSPTPTIQEKAKDDLVVSILNGSGRVGVAGELKELFEEAGFAPPDTGNADSYDYTKTEVYFSTAVSGEIKKEVLDILTKEYGEAVEREQDQSGADVEVIIGQGTPSASPTKAASPTPQPTEKNSPSPSPSI